MKKVIAFLFSLVFVFSCDSDSSNVICTEQYKLISLEIVDTNGLPVALDSLKVMLGECDITYEYTSQGYEEAKTTGMYILLSDEWQKELENIESEIVFTGYIAGEEVVQESFRVTADCCHIQYADTKPLTIVYPGEFK